MSELATPTRRGATQSRLDGRGVWLCLAICTTAATAHGQGNIGAQGTIPQWTFAGRGLVSSPFVVQDGEDHWQLADYADTHVRTRLDSALYDETIASFALGVRLTDVDSPLGAAYPMQIEVALQGEHLVFQAGRRRRPGVEVTMPTLRDEDLLTFLYPLNPYSAGGLEEDAIFTDLISLTYRSDFRWHARFFVESLRDTTSSGDPATRAGIQPNGGGVHLYYAQIPALRRVSVLRQVGVGFFARRAGSKISELDADLLWQTKAEAAANLWPDPVHLVDLRASMLYQHGVDDASIGSVTEDWRSRYVAGVLALRYMWAPDQLDRAQAGVSVGYRRLLDSDLWEVAVIPSAVYRAGGNLDLILQYSYQQRQRRLSDARAVAEREHRVELALSYTFGVTLFGSVNLPSDLVNADYNYVPVN